MPKLKRDLMSFVDNTKCYARAGEPVTIVRRMEHGSIIQVGGSKGVKVAALHDDLDYEEDGQLQGNALPEGIIPGDAPASLIPLPGHQAQDPLSPASHSTGSPKRRNPGGKKKSTGAGDADQQGALFG